MKKTRRRGRAARGLARAVATRYTCTLNKRSSEWDAPCRPQPRDRPAGSYRADGMMESREKEERERVARTMRVGNKF